MPTPEDIVINNPDRQRICFGLANGGEVTVCIRKGVLKVVSDGQLAVFPDASNNIQIKSLV